MAEYYVSTSMCCFTGPQKMWEDRKAVYHSAEEAVLYMEAINHSPFKFIPVYGLMIFAAAISTTSSENAAVFSKAALNNKIQAIAGFFLNHLPNNVIIYSKPTKKISEITESDVGRLVELIADHDHDFGEIYEVKGETVSVKTQNGFILNVPNMFQVRFLTDEIS